MLNAIFYLVKQGCSWQDLPSDFPTWQTVYTYYRGWVKDGTWDASTTDYGPGYGSRKADRKAQQPPENSEAIVNIAMIRIMVQRLA